jgi:hypothetical protein
VANRLEDALENVKDEHTFRIFLNALAEDRRESATDPGSRWQWDKIEDFLEAAGNWSQDSERGLAQYQVPSNVWKRCADIIFSGKIYE